MKPRGLKCCHRILVLVFGAGVVLYGSLTAYLVASTAPLSTVASHPKTTNDDAAPVKEQPSPPHEIRASTPKIKNRVKSVPAHERRANPPVARAHHGGAIAHRKANNRKTTNIDTGTKQKQEEPGKKNPRLLSVKVNETLVNLIQPRAFPLWNQGTICYEPEDTLWLTETQRRHPKGVGFFFLKLLKVGGSTAAGIHLRISWRLMQAFRKREEQQQKKLSQNGTEPNTKQQRPRPFCQGRWDHTTAFEMDYKNRDTTKSFLWSVVREPTRRAVSQFFHFRVSKQNATIASMESHLRSNKGNIHHYLRYLSMNKVSFLMKDERGPPVIQAILDSYDFIGVTERMDESAVALMMLLNLTYADVLYLDAKRQGQRDDRCTRIHPTILSPSVEAYLQSPAWYQKVKWDTVLYHAVNRSLDRTIDSLGRDEFETKLSIFRDLLQQGREKCAVQDIFPCFANGTQNPNRQCLWLDSGCGNDCLDTLFQKADKRG